MAKNSIQEIAGAIAAKHRLSQHDAEAFVTSFFDLINDGLHSEKAVKVKGLGTFKVVDVRERESVNVNTGERVIIESHGKITFTADPIMRDLVNKPFAQFETVVLNDGVELEDMMKVQPADEQSLNENDIDDVESECDASDCDDTDLQRKELVSDDVILKSKNTDDQKQIFHAAEFNEPDDVSKENANTNGIADAVQNVCNNCNVDEDGDSENVALSGEALQCNEEADASQKMCIDDENTQSEACDEYVDRGSQYEEAKNDSDSAENNSEYETSTDVLECVQGKSAEKAANEGSEDVSACVRENNIRTTSVMAWYYWILIIFAVAVASFSAGYYWERYNAKPIIKYVTVKQPSIPLATEISDTVVNGDSANMDVDRLGQKMKDSVASKKNINDRYVTQNDANSSVAAVSGDKQNLKNASTAVRTGAYRIVGTDCIITVKKGETLKKISKFYLGEGMECYIMVHNGVTDIKEGMRLKIPKLINKRK